MVRLSGFVANLIFRLGANLASQSLIWVAGFGAMAGTAMAQVEEQSEVIVQNAIGTFVALGDSMTTGFNADRLLNNFNLSWSTGTQIGFQSEARRLEEFLGGALNRRNQAVAGAVAGNLNGQIDGLGETKPDYVTILMGANDVCGWPDDHQDHLNGYLGQMRGAVDRLIASNPAVRIGMAPVPNMGQLQELGSLHGCQIVWNITGFCSPLLGASRTPEQRQAFLGRLNDLNNGLTALASDYPDNVRFSPELAQVEFEWQHVSRIDCFHPSTDGQGFLAELLWNTGWYQ